MSPRSHNAAISQHRLNYISSSKPHWQPWRSKCRLFHYRITLGRSIFAIWCHKRPIHCWLCKESMLHYTNGFTIHMVIGLYRIYKPMTRYWSKYGSIYGPIFGQKRAKLGPKGALKRVQKGSKKGRKRVEKGPERVIIWVRPWISCHIMHIY